MWTLEVNLKKKGGGAFFLQPQDLISARVFPISDKDNSADWATQIPKLGSI